MTFNTAFAEYGGVARMPGEFFLFSRQNCEFELKVDGGVSLKGVGHVLFSSMAHRSWSHPSVSFLLIPK